MGRRGRGLGDAWPDEAVSVGTRGPARLPNPPPPYPLDRDSETVQTREGPPGRFLSARSFQPCPAPHRPLAQDLAARCARRRSVDRRARQTARSYRATQPSYTTLHRRTQSPSRDGPVRHAATDWPVWPSHQSDARPESRVHAATGHWPAWAAPDNRAIAMAITVCRGRATSRWAARSVHHSQLRRGGDGGAALCGERYSVERDHRPVQRRAAI